MPSRVGVSLLWGLGDGSATLPSEREMRREIADYRQSLDKRYVRSKRHTIQVDFLEHRAEIARERKAGANRLRRTG